MYNYVVASITLIIIMFWAILSKIIKFKLNSIYFPKVRFHDGFARYFGFTLVCLKIVQFVTAFLSYFRWVLRIVYSIASPDLFTIHIQNNTFLVLENGPLEVPIWPNWKWRFNYPPINESPSRVCRVWSSPSPPFDPKININLYQT